MKIHELPWVRLQAQEWAKQRISILTTDPYLYDGLSKQLVGLFIAGLAEGKPIMRRDAADFVALIIGHSRWIDTRLWHEDYIAAFLAGNSTLWKVCLAESP